MILLLSLLTLSPAQSPVVQIQPAKNPREVEVVAKLPTNVKDQIPEGILSQEQGEKWLRFSLVDPKSKKTGPAVLGKYQHKGKRLLFRPRFLLAHQQTYRAIFFTTGAGKPISADYVVPARQPTKPAIVTKVYPTAKVLPANNLKFYIYFSHPMRGGQEIFDQIYLLDEKGKKINAAWLYDELWDEKNQRLLLFIHPGRIKWGLMLRRLLGPVLLPGHTYTLVISGEMRDRKGQPLGKDYKIPFRTSEENRQRIDLSRWKTKAPTAGTTQPLHLTFPQPVDHMSLQRFLKITDAAGQEVAGGITISKQEKLWSFHPHRPWQRAVYTITVDGQLEDVAGNTPRLPFDVDLTGPQPPPQRLTIPFEPKKSTPARK